MTIAARAIAERQTFGQPREDPGEHAPLPSLADALALVRDQRAAPSQVGA